MHLLSFPLFFPFKYHPFSGLIFTAAPISTQEQQLLWQDARHCMGKGTSDLQLRESLLAQHWLTLLSGTESSSDYWFWPGVASRWKTRALLSLSSRETSYLLKCHPDSGSYPQYNPFYKQPGLLQSILHLKTLETQTHKLIW